MAAIANVDTLGQMANILALFNPAGGSTTNTGENKVTQTQIDPVGLQSMLSNLLGSTNGLASVAGGQKSAGLYGSTTNSMLLNDLTTRAAGQVAQNNKVVTESGGTKVQKVPTGQLSLGKTLGTLAAVQLGASGLKKLGGGKSLSDLLGLGDGASGGGIGASASAAEIDQLGVGLPTLQAADGVGTAAAGIGGIAVDDGIAATLGIDAADVAVDDGIASTLAGDTVADGVAVDATGGLETAGLTDAAVGEGVIGDAAIGDGVGAALGDVAVEGAVDAGAEEGVGSLLVDVLSDPETWEVLASVFGF